MHAKGSAFSEYGCKHVHGLQTNLMPGLHSPHITPLHRDSFDCHLIAGTATSPVKQWGSAVLVTCACLFLSSLSPNWCITVLYACCPSYPSGRAGLCPPPPGLLPSLLAHGAGMHCAALQGGGIYLALHHHCLGVWKAGNVRRGCICLIIQERSLSLHVNTLKSTSLCIVLIQYCINSTHENTV